MELSIKTLTLFGSVVLTGLSAGLFYAWQVSVIPGTKKVADLTYLETMQSINRAILNPAFFLIFFGPIILLSIASIYEFNTHKVVFMLLIASAITYLIGTFGVTVLGNVPLNDQLDALQITELSEREQAVFRSTYESKWNRFHLIRTVFSVISFALATASIFISIKDFN